MDSDVFRFKLGSFDCAIVNDGTYIYHEPGTTLLENAPREELAAVLNTMGIELETWRAYVSPYPSLVVKTGDHLVLVDTGMGPRVATTGKLPQNLRSAGFQPNDFDVVVLTHVHPDHAGGMIDSSGKPAFPNARYVLWRREWDFWRHKPDLSGLRNDRFSAMMLDTAARSLPPIQDLVDFVEPGTEIVAGITAIAASGHTVGQIALVIASADEQLLALTDVVLHPVQVVRPEWVSPVDLMVDETVATRRRILELAERENMMVFAPHFEFPSLGHIMSFASGWRWMPQRQASPVG